MEDDVKEVLKCFIECSQLNVSLSDGIPGNNLSENGFHLAISQNNPNILPVLEFLIQNSSTVNQQNVSGNTPLHYCVKENDADCLKLLLKAGADPNIKNDALESPFDIARKEDHRECLQILYDHSSKNPVKNYSFYTTFQLYSFFC